MKLVAHCARLLGLHPKILIVCLAIFLCSGMAAQAQHLNNPPSESCRDYVRVASLLKQSQRILDAGDLNKAIAIADEALGVIGERYYLSGVEDDTDLVLTAARYEAKKGNVVGVASLKLRALRGRVESFGISQNCVEHR